MKSLLDCGGDGGSEAIEFTPGPRKTAQQIARRAIVLCCVTASLSFDSGEFNDWLKREQLWDEVSPKELDLLTAARPNEQQKINASWRCEALQVLLWSIQKIDTLPPITEEYKSGMLDSLPAPGDDTKAFISSAQLRSDKEIDAMLETIVYSHWQLRNEQMHPEQKAPPMIQGVVTERHWALQWLVNSDDEAWDQVPLNT